MSRCMRIAETRFLSMRWSAAARIEKAIRKRFAEEVNSQKHVPPDIALESTARSRKMQSDRHQFATRVSRGLLFREIARSAFPSARRRAGPVAVTTSPRAHLRILRPVLASCFEKKALSLWIRS